MDNILPSRTVMFVGDYFTLMTTIVLDEKLRNEDEAVAIAKFDKVYDTLSEQEIALYEEYNDIEYALKAINPIISILSDIQTNVSVDNDHVLTSGLNNLNLSEVNSNNQVTVIGSSQDDSQSDSEW